MKHGRWIHVFHLAAAVLAVCAAGPLAAQERPAARVGDQVRVTSAAMRGTVRGELVMVRNDSLYVRSGAGRAVAVPYTAVDWIEVRRRRSWLEGLVFGVAVGAPAGTAGGYLFGTLAESGRPKGCVDTCGLLPAIGAAAGLLTGTVLGAIAGGTAPGGRWLPAARPGGGGVALSVGIKM